jgi:hypothetical protein
MSRRHPCLRVPLVVAQAIAVVFGAAGAVIATAQIAPAQPVQLKEFSVVGQPVPGENKTMGRYQQPEWTARRRFVMTSVYVQPEGQMEFEFGYDASSYSGLPSTRRWAQEIEIGLPHRFQLNLENSYQDFRADDPGKKAWHEESFTPELRYALADWGKLPLNPAVSVGWKANVGQADAVDFQLLVADELSPKWHWGSALLYERQLGKPDFREYALSAGLSYSLRNEQLNVGAEFKYSHTVNDPVMGRAQDRVAVGPSLQWRPVDQMHLDVAPLWGIGSRAPRLEVFIFVGFEFGDGADDGDDKPKVEPASLRGR